jgi:hypothetical protein
VEWLFKYDFMCVGLSERLIKSRRMRWAGLLACRGEERKVYKVCVGKLAGKRTLRRIRHRWEDGIKMDLTEIGWECVERIDLADDREWWWAVVSMVINPWVLAPPI